MDRRDPGDRYDRERFHGDPRFEGMDTVNHFEPVCEKTNNLGFRPGPTQTGLYSHSIKLEA